MSQNEPVGFIGLGLMGEPMALNLLRSGTPLVVWNRTKSKSEILAKEGARVTSGSAEVFESSQTVILMLIDSEVTDSVLARGTNEFHKRVHGKTLINMATTEPEYSKSLEADIQASGGRYVEAPVSGSRKPAEDAQLVAMLAGERGAVEAARAIISPMCRDAIICGAVPGALNMKLAVNLFLITMVTGLVEAFHFAEHQGIDLDVLLAVLNAGPMASDVSRVKAAKLISKDFSPQVAIPNVLENNRLIANAARAAGIASPLLDVCHGLYEDAEKQGYVDKDMVAVLHAIETRTKTAFQA